MKKLSCMIFGTTVLISSSTFAFGGEMQAPGYSQTPPPASATELTTDDMTSPMSAEEFQIVLQDLATTVLREVLLTVF